MSIADAMRDARALLDATLAQEHLLLRLEHLADLLAQRLAAGRKIIACGNGGSLCDAAHFVEELTGRFRADRPALAAIALTDAGHLTCVANDYGFDEVFARGVRALGALDDVLIALSTSGNSENLVRALHASREKSMTSVAFLGRGGGRTRGLADVEIVVPLGSPGDARHSARAGLEGETSDRVQEVHMVMLHALVEAIERRLFPADGGRA